MLLYLVAVLLSELFHVARGTLKERSAVILTREQPVLLLDPLHCALTSWSLVALR